MFSIKRSIPFAASLSFSDGKNFVVKEGKEFKNIQQCFVDQILKIANKENFTNLQKQVGYLYTKRRQLWNKACLNGGGAGGASAGVWIGWTITNVVGHGVIFVACRGC